MGHITAAIFGKYNLPYWNNDNIWTEACPSLIRRERERCKRVACMELAFEVAVGNAKLTLDRIY